MSSFYGIFGVFRYFYFFTFQCFNLRGSPSAERSFMEPKRRQMDVTDRIVIEMGLYANRSFNQIAKTLNRHSKTIQREVLNNRTFIPGPFMLNNNDCKYSRTCVLRNICEDGCSEFGIRCRNCISRRCYDHCYRYKPRRCSYLEHPPYVCNHCYQRRACTNNKYMYIGKQADEISRKRRSESRSHIHVRGQELRDFDEFITQQIMKGQPISHIYAEHGDELPVTMRTLYNYIDSGAMTVKNIDLRRKVGYRKRRKKRAKTVPKQSCRVGRTYEDFLRFTSEHPDLRIVQMDTVRGSKKKGPVILTMLFVDTSVMLMFLLPDGKAQTVVNLFDQLTAALGLATFHDLFPVILTDNGSEFKYANALEKMMTGESRCNLFYCDPLASCQKGELEKNHEYIRYILPKGRDFSDLNDEKIIRIMNHINSTKRMGIARKSPYELIHPEDLAMKILMKELKMDSIPPDDVHLMPTLIR